MSTPIAVLLFLGSLALTLAAAGFFADRLDHVGPRLGLPEAIVGLLTAIAADAPEISSAIVALARGEKSISLGVVLGSNAFNLAAMVGVSALVAGTVAIGRRELAIEGVVGLAATAVAAALVLGGIPPWLALVLFGAIALPYLVIVSHRAPAHTQRPTPAHHEGALWMPALLIIPAVGLIVLGSTGMVRSAVVLAGRWQVSQAIVGLIVLAVLTSLPNAFTAIRLGLAGRGAALVSESLGSNTINLVGGLLFPAVVVGLAGRTGLVVFDFAWLVVMTCATLILLAQPAGLRRGGGVLLVALYAVFVAVQLGYA